MLLLGQTSKKNKAIYASNISYTSSFCVKDQDRKVKATEYVSHVNKR